MPNIISSRILKSLSVGKTFRVAKRDRIIQSRVFPNDDLGLYLVDVRKDEHRNVYMPGVFHFVAVSLKDDVVLGGISCDPSLQHTTDIMVAFGNMLSRDYFLLYHDMFEIANRDSIVRRHDKTAPEGYDVYMHLLTRYMLTRRGPMPANRRGEPFSWTEHSYVDVVDTETGAPHKCSILRTLNVLPGLPDPFAEAIYKFYVIGTSSHITIERIAPMSCWENLLQVTDDKHVIRAVSAIAGAVNKPLF